MCVIAGDESHTATEGEGCGGGDDDDDGEEVRRQRERRKQEIRHSAPPKHDDTSDTASDTEVSKNYPCVSIRRTYCNLDII